MVQEGNATMETIEAELDMTEDEITEAIIDCELFAADYPEIFGETIVLDPNRNPYGWDISDTVDWESFDYE